MSINMSINFSLKSKPREKQEEGIFAPTIFDNESVQKDPIFK